MWPYLSSTIIFSDTKTNSCTKPNHWMLSQRCDNHETELQKCEIKKRKDFWCTRGALQWTSMGEGRGCGKICWKRRVNTSWGEKFLFVAGKLMVFQASCFPQKLFRCKDCHINFMSAHHICLPTINIFRYRVKFWDRLTPNQGMLFKNAKTRQCGKSSEEKLFCYDAAGKCHVRIIDNFSRLALRGTMQARKQREWTIDPVVIMLKDQHFWKPDKENWNLMEEHVHHYNDLW